MTRENPMNDIKPVAANEYAPQPDAKPTQTGEGREPERNFKVVNENLIKVSKYNDMSDLFAARAENLFNANQKRAKAMGTKGWNKTSSLYEQWANTTRVVKLADKIKNAYSNPATTPEDLAKAAEWEKEIDHIKTELDANRSEAEEEMISAKALVKMSHEDKVDSAERLAARRQRNVLAGPIETARKEADRIAAEQKKQIEDARLAALLKPGLGGWFKRLFADKEDRAKVAQAREAAMLKKWSKEAAADNATPWTEADERRQEQSITPGKVKAAYNKAEDRFEKLQNDRLSAKMEEVADDLAFQQKIARKEGIREGKAILAGDKYEQEILRKQAKKELKGIEPANIAVEEQEYDEKIRGTVGVTPMRRPSKSGLATRVAKEQPNKWIKPV